jgi:hypothetical protein
MIDEVGGGAFHPHFYAAESPHEKIGIEVFAAKLAVGNGLQTNRFLLGYHPLNSRVLDMVKIVSRYPSRGVVLAGVL